MKHLHGAVAAMLTIAFAVTGCDRDLARPELAAEGAVEARGAAPDGPHRFSAPVFDIAATPDGSILVAEGDVIKEISRHGITEVVAIPTMEGEGPVGVPAVTPINGLEAIGRRNFFATRGGLDLAKGAALWRVSQGGPRLVADIEAFEVANNPDATEGPQWKDERCEAAGGFSAGPQSNPYHLTALSGSEVLIGDAAGNTVLWAKTNGEVDWVALPTPPVDENGDWLVWITLEDGTDCYVQPVPTSVAIGPDGAYYAGELTGITAENIFQGEPSTELSRVWRIEPGARNVLCPSADCEEVISGLTSVIDLAFGPDGRLYVVEYDRNGWFAALELGMAAGGAIQSCDVVTGACDIIEDGLTLPGAIIFDKWDDLWVLESNIIAPMVRRVDLP